MTKSRPGSIPPLRATNGRDARYLRRPKGTRSPHRGSHGYPPEVGAQDLGMDLPRATLACLHRGVRSIEQSISRY